MNTIKNNYLYNLLLQISKVLFPLITAPYVARVLDPQGIGLFGFINIYASYFALFAVLGIPIYGLREIAKRKNDREKSELFVSQMISIELISTLFTSIIYIVSIFLIGKLEVNALYFLLAGIVLYITPFKIEWFFSGCEKFGYITFRSLLIKTMSVVLLFVFVHTKEDLLNYILLSIFATIANEVWNYIKLFNLGIHPYITFTGFREHLKPVLTLFASSIAISIYVMLDTLMLGFQSTYQEVGYYNSAMNLIKTILPVTVSLSAVLLPRVAVYVHSNRIAEINELMNKSLGLVSLLAFPITMGIILVAPIFVPLFFGEQFYGAILPMQIGAGVIVAIGLNNLNGVQILTGMGKDKQFLYSVLSGAIANFMLNLILIPKYGAAGAAISSVYAEIQIFLVNEFFVHKETKIQITNYSDLLKSLCGSLCFIPICYVCKMETTGWLFVFLCIITCGIFYIAFQWVAKNKIFILLLNIIFNRVRIHKL